MSRKAIPLKNPGQFKVCNQLWTVGSKYILHEHIGAGSYGDVCRATDLETNQAVALKRVANILQCPLLAKRVLREVCIMRRLANPYIIALTDVFATPSEVEGEVDLYIATEFADRGDLYHLKEHVSANDVKLLIWQLLVGVKYMHSCGVWHRDIKSENVLLTSRMRVKVCDFGLSRSAEEAASGFEPVQATLNGKSEQGKKVLTRQYTKMVVTPNYRAPEVIMSRGEYNSTIDIWSLGCIFWELLIRSLSQHTNGPLPFPLFGFRGEPETPEAWQNYANDGDSKLARQLDVIFNVIGTPCWKDIQSVPSESWRAYLKRLPGRAGSLAKNLIGFVEDEAIDLLSRMLAFNPARRCTAEEALAHVYFKNMKKPTDMRQVEEYHTSATGACSLSKIKNPSVALEQLERELEASERDHDGGRMKLIMLLNSEIHQQHYQNLLKRSFLCSWVPHNDSSKKTVASSLVVPEEEMAPGQQAVHHAVKFFLPVSCNSELKPVTSTGPESTSCSCVSCLTDSQSNVSHSHDTEEGRKKARKAIIQDSSLRLEIDAKCPPQTLQTAQVTRGIVTTEEIPVLVQPSTSTLRPNHSKQSNSCQGIAIPKGRTAGCIITTNGTNIAVGKCVEDESLVRRSPRFRVDVAAPFTGKRARTQAG